MPGIITGGLGNAAKYILMGYGGPAYGAGPIVLSAENMGDGVLVVIFNQGMKQDAAFTDLSNYTVTPLPGYEAFPITLLDVFAGVDRVAFDFLGGPGAYLITVKNVRDLDEDIVIAPPKDKATFFVNKPGVEAKEVVRIFDSVLGPIGLRQKNVGVQTVEDLMQQRIMSLSVGVQLDNIIAELGPAGAARDSSRIPFLRGSNG